MLYALIATLVLDLIAIAAGAAYPDLFLRPLALFLLLLAAFRLSQSTNVRQRWLFLAGLTAAIVVELAQLLTLSFAVAIFGTAVYYASYVAAFARDIRRKSYIRLALAFLLPAVYAIAGFLFFDPYGFLRFPSMGYAVVFILFVGLAIAPILQGGKDAALRFRLAGVLGLAISDSLRAFTLFKGPFAWSEFFILLFYFVGMVLIAASFAPELRSKLQNSAAMLRSRWQAAG